jgi:hypothetical protein
MTKQCLTFYTLTEDIVRKRLNKILQGRPLDSLRCSICGRAFELNEKIVRRRKKLYHLSCFNNSIFDISDDVLDAEDILLIEGYYANSSTINTSISSISTTVSVTIPILS